MHEPSPTRPQHDAVRPADLARLLHGNTPPGAALALLQDKVREADAGWIGVFRAEGAFALDGAPASLARAPGQDWRVHPQADPAIEALALALQGRSQYPQYEVQIDGRQFMSALWESEFDTNTPWAVVLGKIVRDFIAAVRGNGNDQGRSRIVANAAVLLCLAIAVGDDESVKALNERVPEAVKLPLRAIFAHDADWVTPAFVAIHLGRVTALAALAQQGWSPTGTVALSPVADAPSGAQESLRALSALDLLTLAAREGATFAQLRPASVQALAEMIDVQDRDTAGLRELQVALLEYVRQHGGHCRHVVVWSFLKCGLLSSPEATQALAVTATDSLHVELFAHVAHGIDWAAFSDGEFPPYLALVGRPGSFFTPEQREFVNEMCRQCEAAGHGQRLVNHVAPAADGTQALLHLLAQHGITDGVLLALEHGTDPSRQDPRGQTAVQCAEAAGHADTAAVLRSFAAKRAAAAALSDVPIPHP